MEANVFNADTLEMFFFKICGRAAGDDEIGHSAPPMQSACVMIGGRIEETAYTVNINIKLNRAECQQQYFKLLRKTAIKRKKLPIASVLIIDYIYDKIIYIAARSNGCKIEPKSLGERCLNNEHLE